MSLMTDDRFETEISSYEMFHEYISDIEKQKTEWIPCTVGKLKMCEIGPDEKGTYAGYVSEQGAEDAAENGTGLCIEIGERKYPLRETAVQSVFARAGISGRTLKLLAENSKKDLCSILNRCFECYPDTQAKALYRLEKISAVHSGDYAVLPQSELLETVENVLNDRFPGWVFENGIFSHGVTRAYYSLPGQKNEIMAEFDECLKKHGRESSAETLLPGLVFSTSDTANSNARVSAFLFGGERPVAVGCSRGIIHRGRKKTDDFREQTEFLFAGFEDSLRELGKMMSVPVRYPVECMTNVCRAFQLPKLQSLAAIDLYASVYTGEQTAYDIYTALQEVLFNCEAEKFTAEKLFSVEENIARVCRIRHWTDFDIPAKAW